MFCDFEFLCGKAVERLLAGVFANNFFLKCGNCIIQVDGNVNDNIA
jgi:hypothetical protein